MDMENTAKTLITLGVLLLIGFATDAIGKRTRLPRVTLLLTRVASCAFLRNELKLIFGFAIGPVGFGWGWR
jgi:hypothetical protein